MHRLNETNRKTLAERAAGFVCLALALLGFASSPEAQAQTTSVPPVVFSSSSFLGGTNSTGPSASPDYQANIGSIAANQRGDIFAIFADFTGSGYNSLVEVPAGTNTQILLAKHVASGVTATGVTVDSKGNVWFLTLAPDGYDNGVDIIPFVDGSYASGIDLASSTLPNCSLPIYPVAAPCQYPNIVASNFYGYLQLSDLSVDPAGNLYVVDWADSVTGYDAQIQIVKYDATTGADSIVLGGLPPPAGSKTNGRVSVAPNGDIYYVDQLALYYSKAGSLTSAIIPGFNKPSGVSVDSGGNVYVTDSGNNRIAVLPSLAGAVSASSTYTILSGSVLGVTPYYSAGVDGSGTITYPGTSNANAYYRASIEHLNLGTINVGSSSAATDLDIYFTAAQTLGPVTVAGGSAFALTTNGCTAGTAYAAGSTCSVSVTYTPTAPGVQSGAVQVFSQSGTLLGTASISGTGVAPLLTVDPGTPAAIGSGWKSPSAIALDSAGNTYVADATTGSIYKNGSSTAIASGFNAPSAIVVDGAGDLYVGDSGNSQIVEVPYSGTAYGTPVVLQTGLTGPSGLALDAAGDLYVADSGGARVLHLSSAAGQPLGTLVASIGSGFTTPVAVATDNAGNVYVSDSGTGQISQYSFATNLTSAVVTGLKSAAGLAVDAGGSLYYADSGAATIVRVRSVSGSLDTGSSITLANPVAAPSGIAVDLAGNLYATDSTDATVGELSRTNGLLDFGQVVVNDPSQLLSATLSDAGNAPLAFSTPYETANGNAADFASQSTTTCSAGLTVAVGGSCSLPVIFTPSVIAPETSTLTFASNAATAALVLQGVGTPDVKVTITGATTLVYGNVATYAVTASMDGTYKVNISGSATASTSVVVTSGVGSFSVPVLKVGTYTLGLAGTTGTASLSITPAPLTVTGANATRVYGMANPVFTATVTGAVNGDSFVASATSAATVTSNAGTYPIVPTVAGSAIANYTVTLVDGTLTVSQAASNTNVTVSSSNNFLLGGTVTFTAKVISLGSGQPTGTVTFEDATTANDIKVLGTGTLSSGVATFSTAALPAGTIYVVGVYSGDVDFLTSSSAASPVAINLPTFTLAATPQTLQIIQGQSGMVTLTVTPVGDFTSPVTFSCSGLPLESSCSFSSPSIAPSGGAPATAMLTIKTTGASTTSAAVQHSSPWKTVGGSTVLALMLGSFAGFRRKRFAKGLCLFLLVGVLCLLPITGCGLDEKNFVTPLGISTVTITGACAANNTTLTTNLRLAVYTTSN